MAETSNADLLISREVASTAMEANADSMEALVPGASRGDGPGLVRCSVRKSLTEEVLVNLFGGYRHGVQSISCTPKYKMDVNCRWKGATLCEQFSFCVYTNGFSFSSLMVLSLLWKHLTPKMK